MTKIKFLLFTLFCVVLSLQTTSCSSGDDDKGPEVGVVNAITGIAVDQATLSIKEGETATVTAMKKPLNATGTITWTSSNAAVATVDSKGVVTGVKKGTASIAAAIGTFTAICEVTVTEKEIIVDSAILKGSDYYVIQLDENSFKSISGKVISDFRPDNITKNLFVWENTFGSGISDGPNFFGLDQDWVSLIVGNVGWSGAGFNVNADFGEIDMTRMYKNPEDYYLHISLKTDQKASSFLFILTDKQTEAKIAFGDDFIDNGTKYTSYAQISRDGKWNSIDIPVKHLNDLGLFFNKSFKDVNILAVLAGGTSGATLDMDAVFFYKKAK